MEKYIVDSHCDSALKFYQGEGINSINNQFRLEEALKYDKYIQIFASYIEPEYIKTNAFDLAISLVNSIKQKISIYSDKMFLILSKYDLEQYLKLKNKKLGCMLSVEDGMALNGKIENLDKLYLQGVRMLGLTWNLQNEIATGADVDKVNKKDYINEDGLTYFGEQVIERMNQLNMIIDVSHLSQKSFYDVVSRTKKPIVASHSNARKICDNVRNLNDDQIKKISDIGGIIGINFYSNFVSNNPDDANILMLIKHIQHIEKIGGVDCVGIGSDFDGMHTPTHGLEDNSKIEDLIDMLSKQGFSDNKIEKIIGGNYINFLRSNLI